jgi:hypothetical protein
VNGVVNLQIIDSCGRAQNQLTYAISATLLCRVLIGKWKVIFHMNVLPNFILDPAQRSFLVAVFRAVEPTQRLSSLPVNKNLIQ